MWFQILPAYLIVTASIAAPGYATWWIWYFALGNILPTFFIITAGLGLPGWGLYHIHNLVLGNHYRRNVLDRWERSQYQRDMRLSGHPYVVNGLEQIEEYKPKPEDTNKRVTPEGKPFSFKK